ncbi:MAG: hypothetical protein HRT89_14070, partial [Lentisphaeria bacterium]|nr:hypothetical protein [Lentisphaeria bacterium]NQZ69182.1 hypothetical protein [Lentisphaeria bacterium]
MSKSQQIPGMTPRAIAASIFCMLVMGMYLQVDEMIIGGSDMAEQSVAIPALSVFLGLITVCGIIFSLSKFTLLSKQETFCVLFTMILSVPMMTQGMWHRFFALTTSIPRTGNFQNIDGVHDNLWPHGKNLIAEQLSTGTGKGNLTWNERAISGKQTKLPLLKNTKEAEESFIRLDIPIGEDSVRVGEAYFFSVLLLPKDLLKGSNYFARFYHDGDTTPVYLLQGSNPATQSFIHTDPYIRQEGFIRVGSNSASIAPDSTGNIHLEIGLRGPGSLEIHDPKFFNFSVIKTAFSGKRVISESEFAKLPVEDRANLIVKPDNMFTLAGFSYLVGGYIPVKAWIIPAITWSIPISLLLIGTFCINIIMRRQWAENERFPFPLFQIPGAMLGLDDPDADGTPKFAQVFRNKIFWWGAAFAFCWGMMRFWHSVNPAVPNINFIFEALSPNKITASSSEGIKAVFGNLNFKVSFLVVAICLFFEVNILFSFIIGMMMFQSLHGIGKVYNLKALDNQYPFQWQQPIGAYLAYGVLVLFLARKYLFDVVSIACTRNDESKGEVLSYRSTLIILALVPLGFVAWSVWLGLNWVAILIFFSFLLLIGFVCAKFRSECGLPGGYFSPYNSMLLVALLGGMASFGPQTMMFTLIASGFLTVSVFFFIPGAQMELIEFGKRYNIIPRHLLYTMIIGIGGGLFIGGWVFLSNLYSLGGDNIKTKWSIDGQDWYFRSYRTELSKTTAEWKKENVANTESTAKTKSESSTANPEPASPVKNDKKGMPLEY